MLAALPGCSAGGNKNAEDVSSSAAESMSETADESTPEDTSNTTEDSSAQTTPAVEDITEDTDTLDDTQRNSINMLNYITVLTQEISDSKGEPGYIWNPYILRCQTTPIRMQLTRVHRRRLPVCWIHWKLTG